MFFWIKKIDYNIFMLKVYLVLITLFFISFNVCADDEIISDHDFKQSWTKVHMTKSGESLEDILKIYGLTDKDLNLKLDQVNPYRERIKNFNPHIRNFKFLRPGLKVYIDLPYTAEYIYRHFWQYPPPKGMPFIWKTHVTIRENEQLPEILHMYTKFTNAIRLQGKKGLIRQTQLGNTHIKSFDNLKEGTNIYISLPHLKMKKNITKKVHKKYKPVRRVTNLGAAWGGGYYYISQSGILGSTSGTKLSYTLLNFYANTYFKRWGFELDHQYLPVTFELPNLDSSVTKANTKVQYSTLYIIRNSWIFGLLYHQEPIFKLSVIGNKHTMLGTYWMGAGYQWEKNMKRISIKKTFYQLRLWGGMPLKNNVDSTIIIKNPSGFMMKVEAQFGVKIAKHKDNKRAYLGIKAGLVYENFSSDSQWETELSQASRNTSNGYVLLSLTTQSITF